MLQTNPEDGSIFIDRDGDKFRLILDFLRDMDASLCQRTIRSLPEEAREATMREVDYFGLEVAIFGEKKVLFRIEDAEFRPGPEISVGRSGCAAAMARGRVVVFGGYSNGTGAFNSTGYPSTSLPLRSI